MEGIRALGVVTMIDGLCSVMKTIPEDLNVECDDEIIKDGFIMYVKTMKEQCELEKCVEETMLLKSYEITKVTDKIELENIFGIVNSIDIQEDINDIEDVINIEDEMNKR